MIETSLVRAKAVEAAIKGDLTLDYTCAVSSKDELSDLMERDINSATIQPYAIRDSWLWVELSEIVANVKYPFADGPFGSNLKREHYTTDHQVRIIQLSNIGELGWKDDNEKYTTYEHLETIKRSEVEAGNIVIAKMMPAGRAVIVPGGSSKYVLSSDCVKYVPFEKLNARYICYAINSPMFRKQVLGGVHGIGRERTSLSKLKKYVIPLPTIEEQDLIVERLDRIFDLLDSIDAWQRSYSDNFEVLKRKIIDAGIRGELTEQLPEDGTAEELYQQIQAEKATLIKEKKIKKSKPLPEITADEIPFDIPDNWKWVYLGNVAVLQSGQDLKSTEYNSDREGIPYLTGASNVNQDGEIIINRWTPSPKNIASQNDVLITCKGTVGRLSILREKQVHIARQFMAVKPISIDSGYIKLFLESVIAHIKAASKGLIPGIERNDILELNLPLPPFAEQKRIVERIEELLTAMPK